MPAAASLLLLAAATRAHGAFDFGAQRLERIVEIEPSLELG